MWGMSWHKGSERGSLLEEGWVSHLEGATMAWAEIVERSRVMMSPQVPADCERVDGSQKDRCEWAENNILGYNAAVVWCGRASLWAPMCCFWQQIHLINSPLNSCLVMFWMRPSVNVYHRLICLSFHVETRPENVWPDTLFSYPKESRSYFSNMLNKALITKPPAGNYLFIRLSLWVAEQPGKRPRDQNRPMDQHSLC